MNTNLFEKCNTYKPEIRSLILRLQRAGFCVTHGSGGRDGQDSFPLVKGNAGLRSFVDSLTACDDAKLYVRTPKGEKLWLYLVFGNEPGVVVCDHTCDDDGLLERIVTEHADAWENRKQPVEDGLTGYAMVKGVTYDASRDVFIYRGKPYANTEAGHWLLASEFAEHEDEEHSAVVAVLNRDVTTPEMIQAARREHRALLAVAAAANRLSGLGLQPRLSTKELPVLQDLLSALSQLRVVRGEK